MYLELEINKGIIADIQAIDANKISLVSVASNEIKPINIIYKI